jgi:L-asparaginase
VIFRRQAMPHAAWRDPTAEPGLRVSRLDTRVELVQAFTGMDAGPIDFACSRAPRGLALIAFGRGNVPPAIVPALRRALDAGIIVTVSSRCVGGRVSPRYGYDGGGLQLQSMGAILAGDLPGAKARLLQMVVLGYAPNTTEAKVLIRTMTD